MHYMPHGFCLLWNPYLIGVFVLAHFLVFLAYLLVPLELIRGMKKARISIPLELRLVILDITVFILACGGGHLIGITLLWWPHYWFEALWTLLGTAVFSWRCWFRIHKRVRFFIPMLMEPMRFAELKSEVIRLTELVNKSVGE